MNGHFMYGLLLDIDWKMLLLGEESWDFLVETVFRTIIMFLVILLSLRFLGKRGIKQLSVFELGVIIGLGSAAGDPMFYKDVGLLPGVIVFIIVVTLYKLVTYFINQSDKFETFVEGEPTYIIKQGRILQHNFEKEPIARDELYMQLRFRNITQLGQVDECILETNGELSVIYYPDKEVIYGLPIMPDQLKKKSKVITQQAIHSCTNCAHTENLEPAGKTICKQCGKDEWVVSINKPRVH